MIRQQFFFSKTVALAAVLLLGLESKLTAERFLSANAEATTWLAWWRPETLRDAERGVFADYKIQPAFLTGFATTVSVAGQSHFAFEYLAAHLEGEMRSQADAFQNDIVFNLAAVYRPLLLQRVWESRYLLTRLDIGKFTGSAQLAPTRDHPFPQKKAVSTTYFLGDLLWMKDDGGLLCGWGIKTTRYKLPTIIYDVSGPNKNPLYSNPRLMDTSHWTLSFAVAARDRGLLGPPEHPEKRNFTTEFYIHELLLAIGYAESQNTLIGNASGLALGADLDGGYRLVWFPRQSQLSLSMGLRWQLSLIQTSSGEDEDRRSIGSRTMLLGPYMRIAVRF